jgi:hypothetical protein
MAGKGGARPGAGRKSNAARALTDEELRTLREGLIRDLPAAAVLALQVLQQTLTAAEPDAARVSAAKYLIDRVLGRTREQALPGFEELERSLLETQARIAREELRNLELRNALLAAEAAGKGLSLDAPPFDPLAPPTAGGS